VTDEERRGFVDKRDCLKVSMRWSVVMQIQMRCARKSRDHVHTCVASGVSEMIEPHGTMAS
jgi:hypothetical protein